MMFWRKRKREEDSNIEAVKDNPNPEVKPTSPSIDPDIECEVLRRHNVYVVRHIASGQYVGADTDRWTRNDEAERKPFAWHFSNLGMVHYSLWFGGKWDAYPWMDMESAKSVCKKTEDYLREKKDGISQAFVDEVRVWR